MFARITITRVLHLNVNTFLGNPVASLLHAAEQPEIVLSIEFAHSLLLFAIMSGNPQLGAIYWLDRKNGTWYSIDFDDQEYHGYNVQQFESLLQNFGFPSLIERPGLLRSGLLWTRAKCRSRI